MDLVTEFYWHSVFTSVFCLLFFSIPGLWISLLLGFNLRLPKQPSAFFISTALGLSCYGAFSLLFCWLVGFTVATVIGSWLLFQAIAAAVYFRLGRFETKQALFEINTLPALFLLLAVVLYAILPVMNIYPAIYEGGLFVNDVIFDHVKMAIVSSMSREGLPPQNPYYAPAGQRIPLVYYYGWHFMVAEIKLLTGISVWYAEIAMTWLTGFATISLIIALAIRLTGQVRTGWFVIAFALTSMLPDMLALLLGGRWLRWVGWPPSTHPLELLYYQLSWAPQHVFAGMCVVLLIFLTTQVISNVKQRWLGAVLIGWTVAQAFNASVWVGGVGLILALPFLVFALWRLRLNYAPLAMPLLLAVLTCVLFALPVLLSEISGPPADKFPIEIRSYTSTALFPQNGPMQKLGHLILYWLQFLPLSFGIIFVLGLPAVLAYAPKQDEPKAFKNLSLAAIIGYLVAAQFFQSVVGSNDFGWRAIDVPVILLMLWAAVGLAELPNQLNRMNWRADALVVRYHKMVVPLSCVGLTLGLLSSGYIWVFPKPHHRHNPPSSAQLMGHQNFFKLRQPWNAVLNYTQPNDLVQSNPDSYSSRVLTRWSAPAAMVLFGDRAMAYAEPESVQTFAHSYNKAQKAAQYKAVQAIFSANPNLQDLLYARDTLKIKALIVEKYDPVWNSQIIEQSGVYKIAERSDYYRIYLAN